MPKSRNPKKSISTQQRGVPLEVVDLLPRIKLLPGEDVAVYEGLRQALMAELVPGTPYETILVQNLITLEWEGMRHRNLKDGLILAEYRNQAMPVFQREKAKSLSYFYGEEEAGNVAVDLVDPDATTRPAADDQLAKCQNTPTENLAKAYESVYRSVEIHERKIADIEIRRRRLREDFDRLKAARTRTIEEAEIVEET